MERIQSAIEKARARRGQTGVKRPDASADASPTAPISTTRSESRTDFQDSTTSVPPQAESGRVDSPVEEMPQDSQYSRVPLSKKAIDATWAQLTPCFLDAPSLIRKRILTLRSGGDAVLFDQIRTKVLQTMRANNWRRLAIASPLPASGKSTLSLNLALSLSRQPDLRTVLLDLDMRRPSLASLLGVKPRGSIAAWLQGRAQFSDLAMCWNYNLAILTNDTPLHNSSELLASQKTAEALARMEAQYAPDIVICDTPPMQVVDDMMAFAAKVDAVLLVAAAEENTVKQIDTCETELVRGTNVMGVVLNKCQHLDELFDYGY